MLPQKDKLNTLSQSANRLHEILQLTAKERLPNLLGLKQAKVLPPSCKEVLSSNNGIIALHESLITPEHILKMYENQTKLLHPSHYKLDNFWPILLSAPALVALRAQLITPEYALKIYNSDPPKLSLLLSHNGVIALSEKLITPKKVQYMRNERLSSLLSDNGLYALRKKLITPQQASTLHINTLNTLLSDKGIVTLLAKITTTEQVANIPWQNFNFLSFLFELCAPKTPELEDISEINPLPTIFCNTSLSESWESIRELYERLIIKKQSKSDPKLKFNDPSFNLYQRDAFIALSEKLLTLQQAIDIYQNKPDNLQILLSPNGMYALRKKLITPEQAANIHPEKLRALLSNTGVSALAARVITAELAEYDDISINNFRALCSYNGVSALQNGLITINQTHLPHLDILLLDDNGLDALREGRITPEQAAEMSCDMLHGSLRSSNAASSSSAKGRYGFYAQSSNKSSNSIPSADFSSAVVTGNFSAC